MGASPEFDNIPEEYASNINAVQKALAPNGIYASIDDSLRDQSPRGFVFEKVFGEESI